MITLFNADVDISIRGCGWHASDHLMSAVAHPLLGGVSPAQVSEVVFGLDLFRSTGFWAGRSVFLSFFPQPRQAFLLRALTTSSPEAAVHATGKSPAKEVCAMGPGIRVAVEDRGKVSTEGLNGDSFEEMAVLNECGEQLCPVGSQKATDTNVLGHPGTSLLTTPTHAQLKYKTENINWTQNPLNMVFIGNQHILRSICAEFQAGFPPPLPNDNQCLSPKGGGGGHC